MSIVRKIRRVRSILSTASGEAYVGLGMVVMALIVLALGQLPSHVQAGDTNRAKIRTTTERTELSVVHGNALDDGRKHNGWWIGHFIDSDNLRNSQEVETKWVLHKAGEKHDGFFSNKVATSMAVLINGRHRIEFENESVTLNNSGDYVVWGPGVSHSWLALNDSTMLCVRWPSLKNDQQRQKER